MYVLVDCNQFFVSCEKVFRPELNEKPVAVLSNNDGCIIARSPEVKAMGVPMGAPYFKYEEILKRNKVVLFSSNYTLYADLSARVMETLASFETEMEVYSVDEAFLWYEGSELLKFCNTVKERVRKWTGIPVSVGAGPTKTLAKAANECAKEKKMGCFILSAMDSHLKHLPVEEIWGIGRKTALTLNRKGIYSAEQFALADEEWIKKTLSITGLRTAMELKGVPCLEMEAEESAKKGVMCSRSFGTSVFDLESLLESVATYTAKASEKIRRQGSAASYMQVHLMTSRFDPVFAKFMKSGFTAFKEPASYTPFLIDQAKNILKTLYSEGVPYKKTAIYLGGLVPSKQIALDLFEGISPRERTKQEKLMALLDRANHRKDNSLFFLAEGIEQPWKMKRSLTSPSYTTSWEELPKVKAD